ncbi:MAG: tRNA (guanosine(46)-N7)-methyltransferase TrmB, partial [Erysipelotrichaceae bacterium]|nr:tRNA (guanosine(46)-N7)-methyltransferase TrmB [Erysipelotrichaceae bacterium]
NQLADGRQIHVEIGAGKGDYWIAMAHQYPECLWIAIEKDVDCAAIALKKSLDQTSANMKMIIGYASELENWFAGGEIDVIHLNFSDPWPKKRHTKRRLTYDSFLQVYERILKPEGELQFKTDNSGLFEYSLVSFASQNWNLKEVSVDWRREEHPEDAITEYESNFMELGQPIYRAVWQLKKDRE